METEIWTAKEKIGEGDNELIVFDVLDQETGKVREEKRYTAALPLMMELSGYPAFMGTILQDNPLTWRFKKAQNGQIYLEGKSTGGDDNYYPIKD